MEVKTIITPSELDVTTHCMHIACITLATVKGHLILCCHTYQTEDVGNLIGIVVDWANCNVSAHHVTLHSDC